MSPSPNHNFADFAAGYRRLNALEFFAQPDGYTRFLSDWSTRAHAFQNRIFTVKATGLSYRLIHTWGAAGLLDPPYTVKPKRFRWRRFSRVDLVLLELFYHLRRFGFSLTALNSFRLGLAVQDLAEDDPNTEYSKKHGAYLVYLAYRVLSGADVVIAVFPDGKFAAGTWEAYAAAQAEGKLKHHIALDFNAVTYRLFPQSRENHQKFRRYWAEWLTPKEAHLVALVRLGGFDAVTVKSKNGRIQTFSLDESTPVGHMKPEEFQSYLAEMLASGESYEDLEIRKKDHHPIYVKRRRKILA